MLAFIISVFFFFLLCLEIVVTLSMVDKLGLCVFLNYVVPFLSKGRRVELYIEIKIPWLIVV